MYYWNEEKDLVLRATRGFGFEDAVRVISQGEVLDNYKHPLGDKYPNQYIYVIRLGGYVHYIPYVIDGDNFFLKNIIPSRKLEKLYKE